MLERRTLFVNTLPGFTDSLLSGGLIQPVAMDFAPDGRIFVTEKMGKVRVIKDGQLLPTPFVTLPVSSSGERGALGITLDPDFAQNNFVYVYHTATAPNIHNRVSRFTASGDVAATGSEFVVLDLDPLSSATNHNGGAIHFGLDGKLYVSQGDNGNAPFSQALENRFGKILRINPDGSIPSDNPFFNTATGANRSIWAYGLRNPFTFAFHATSGRMFINDVGSSLFEEINEGIAGANYGWPQQEGPASSDPALTPPVFFYDRDSGAPIGRSINGGAFYDGPVQSFPAEFANDYFFADLSGRFIWTLDSATGAAAEFATDLGPAVDLTTGPDGSLYYVAYTLGQVRQISFGQTTPAPTIVSQPTPTSVTVGEPATFSVQASGDSLRYQWQRNGFDIPGATDASYTLQNTVITDNGDKFRVVVSNSGGDAFSNTATLTVTAVSADAPVILTQPASASVNAGEPATFSVQASGDNLTYQWQRNGIDIPGATSSQYMLGTTALIDNGAVFRVVVTGAQAAVTSNDATLIVTANEAPTAVIISPVEGRQYRGGQTIRFKGRGTDPEQGRLPAASMSWRVEFIHDQESQPVISETPGHRRGSFRVPRDGEMSASGLYRIHLTVTDAGGRTNTTSRDIRPQTVQISVTASHPGLRFLVDGQATGTPALIDAVVATRHTFAAETSQIVDGVNYTFQRWSPRHRQEFGFIVPHNGRTLELIYTAL